MVIYQLYTCSIWEYDDICRVIDNITNLWQNWEWFRWQNWERRWFPGDHIIINYQMLIYIIMYCNVNYRPTLNVDGSTESILQYPPDLDTVDICGSCVLKNHHSSIISWNLVRKFTVLLFVAYLKCIFCRSIAIPLDLISSRQNLKVRSQAGSIDAAVVALRPWLWVKVWSYFKGSFF